MLAYCEEIVKENRGICLIRLQYLILQVIFRDSWITTCIVGHWWWFRWHAYSSRGSASSL